MQTGGNKINKVGLGALAFGHMVVDMQTSSLAVLIPILYAYFSLDYAGAALIVTLNSLTSSFIQPVFGIVSDKKSLRWLLPLGCLLCSAGMVLVSFMPNYWLVLLFVIISGLGSAAYHPEGSRNANYVSGENKASGMSVFFVGGNLGFALGPIFTTTMLALFGPSGTIGLLVPGLIGVFVLWRMLPVYARSAEAAKYRRNSSKTRAEGAPTTRRGIVKLMAIILSIISVRSVIQTGMVTFIPLYFATMPGDQKKYGAFLLSVFVFSGAIGTLLGGQLADRLGPKNVMIGSMLVTSPMLLLFLNSSGFIQVLSIGIAGAALISAASLTIVMAQTSLPNNIGLASGLTLGLGFGAGGLGATALGKYADTFGLAQTLFIISFLPLAIIGFSLLLPMQKKKAVQVQPAPVVEAEAMVN